MTRSCSWDPPTHDQVAYSSAEFTLDNDVLRKWYELNGQLVYFVTDLHLTGDYETSFCTDNTDSRWKMSDGECGADATTFTDTDTLATVTAALTEAVETATSLYVVDVDITEAGGICVDTDGDTIGAKVTVESSSGSTMCLEHVHPHEES